MANSTKNANAAKQRSLLGAALVLVLFLALAGILISAQPAAAQTIPTITVLAVQQDQTVTVRTHNFPANRDFTVRMGAMGTRGENGTVVASTNSGAGGTFDVTYNIPAALRGARQIAIRLEAPGGYYSYNWFYNRTATMATPPATVTAPAATATPGATATTGATATAGPTNTPAATGTPAATATPAANIPTFRIISVERDNTVTIRTNNFPANQTFTVRMGALGSRGVNGTVAGTQASGTGGTFDATYTIPQNLRGRATIAIRLESPQGYYAYNWFYNSTTP